MVGGRSAGRAGYHEIDPLAGASTTRTCCLEHASRSFSWTTSEFHGTRGEVPARQGIEQKNVHDVVLVESST